MSSEPVNAGQAVRTSGCRSPAGANPDRLRDVRARGTPHRAFRRFSDRTQYGRGRSWSTPAARAGRSSSSCPTHETSRLRQRAKELRAQCSTRKCADSRIFCSHAVSYALALSRRGVGILVGATFGVRATRHVPGLQSPNVQAADRQSYAPPARAPCPGRGGPPAVACRSATRRDRAGEAIP